MAEAIAVSGSPSPSAAEAVQPEPNESLLQTPVPFGPFLSAAAAAFALFQPQLLHWYLS
jgi:hypothetical protein